MIKQNDPRRWRERADGSMVNEDRNAPSNLPRDVMIKRIPHHAVPMDPSIHGDLPVFGKPTAQAIEENFYRTVERPK